MRALEIGAIAVLFFSGCGGSGAVPGDAPVTPPGATGARKTAPAASLVGRWRVQSAKAADKEIEPGQKGVGILKDVWAVGDVLNFRDDGTLTSTGDVPARKWSYDSEEAKLKTLYSTSPDPDMPGVEEKWEIKLLLDKTVRLTSYWRLGPRIEITLVHED
jgi:hypothetical protein